MDPLAEKYSGWSPYNYVLNNPVRVIDPTGLSPEDIIIKGQIWKPGATAKGDDKFTNKVFNALNSLYVNVQTTGAGNVQTSEASGNVIMDFVGKESPDVEIREAPEGGLNNGGSYADENGKAIYWNSTQGIEVNPNKTDTNVPGNISSETLLAHEFGHAWLAQFSPNLNSKLESLDSNESKTRDKNGLDPFEHNSFILPKVENSFSRARGEGVRTEYRGTSSKENERTLQKATGLKRNINFDYRIKY